MTSTGPAHRFPAKVYFRTKAEGGQTAVASGIRPSIDIDGDLTACKVLCGSEGTFLDQGRDLDAIVELSYTVPGMVERLQLGFRFRLTAGSWEIGSGTVAGPVLPSP